ncbi:unnamed protein product, partial [Didymodactylos carnosus]
LPNAETDVNELVRTTAKRLIEYGAAVVEEISIPEHKLGPVLLTGVVFEGGLMSLLHNSGPSSLNEKFHTSLLDYTKKTMVAASHEWSPTLKSALLTGQWIHNQYPGHFYAKATNLARWLTQKYDEQLNIYDVLIMPTLPCKATKLPTEEEARDPTIVNQKASEMTANTCVFNITHHPAMTVPVGFSPNAESVLLPVGLMIIGKHYDEATIYRVAKVIEESNSDSCTTRQ